MPSLKVSHDHEKTQNVTWCKEEGCYSLDLDYSIPDVKMEILIALSNHCEQEIQFEVA